MSSSSAAVITDMFAKSLTIDLLQNAGLRHLGPGAGRVVLRRDCRHHVLILHNLLFARVLYGRHLPTMRSLMLGDAHVLTCIH